MYHTGVPLPDECLTTRLRCPNDCPTPCPHSLTSISLLVSPQQIRKASQHLHGDGPQSSRWPQCAARQLKRERRAGKRKWVRIRGSRARQREAASASGLRTDVRTCALGGEKHAYTHTHMRGGLFTPRCTPSRVFPAKTNTRPTPVTKRQHCENEKRTLGRRGKCGAQTICPPPSGSRTPDLLNGEKSENLPPELHGQIPQPNQ